MKEYHKIQSLYKRDDRGRFLVDQWSRPEIEYLAGLEWGWTEKVDGTNIRIGVDVHGNYHVGGRTSRAQIQVTLLDAIRALDLEAKLHDQMTRTDDWLGLCLYGEGYGPKIQKGGGNYRDTQGFVLFDVRIGHWWLQRDDVQDIGDKLGLDVVPTVGYGTLAQGEDFVRDGFKSTWGDFEAEGIVARPVVPMFNRKGERIITKLKAKDYRRAAA